MYLRNQGVFVVDKFENIPFDIVETSNQIVLIEDKDNHEEFSRTRTLVLDSKLTIDNKDIHIGFEEYEVTSNYRTNDAYCYDGDEKPSIKSSYARNETKHHQLSYIKLVNGELFEIDSDMRRRTIEEMNKGDKEAYELIDAYCFSRGYRMFGLDNTIFKDSKDLKNTRNSKFYHFISLKVTENLELVLLVEDILNPKDKVYVRYKSVFFIHKDGTYFKFEADFDKLLDTLERIYCEINEYSYEDYFKKFKELLQKTTLENYLKFVVLNKYDRIKFIKEMKSQLFKTYSSMLSNVYDEFEDLFKPVHIDNEFEFFTDSTNGYLSNLVVVKDREIINKKENKSDEEKNGMRIGFAISEFERNGKIGISPFDGQYYEMDRIAKQIIDKSQQYIQYKDFEGIILNNNYSETSKYYIKITGYYVRADLVRDKEAIDDLKERKRVVDALDRAL